MKSKCNFGDTAYELNVMFAFKIGTHSLKVVMKFLLVVAVSFFFFYLILHSLKGSVCSF